MTPLVNRLLGRKPQTSGNIAAEIEVQTSAIEAARAKIVAAKTAREAAIDAFDADGHRKADEDIAEANREIERRERAILKLHEAHATRVDVEARQQFKRADSALKQEGEKLAARIRAEYEPAANIIATLMRDLADYNARRKSHESEAKSLGEPATAEDPEAFRGTSPRKWSASWPAPEGGYEINGGIEDAPRGSIKWINGEPKAVRDDVEIFDRGGGARPTPLAESIGNLPGLMLGDKPIHVGWKLVIPPYIPLADRL